MHTWNTQKTQITGSRSRGWRCTREIHKKLKWLVPDLETWRCTQQTHKKNSNSWFPICRLKMHTWNTQKTQITGSWSRGWRCTREIHKKLKLLVPDLETWRCTQQTHKQKLKLLVPDLQAEDAHVKYTKNSNYWFPISRLEGAHVKYTKNSNYWFPMLSLKVHTWNTQKTQITGSRCWNNFRIRLLRPPLRSWRVDPKLQLLRLRASQKPPLCIRKDPLWDPKCVYPKSPPSKKKVCIRKVPPRKQYVYLKSEVPVSEKTPFPLYARKTSKSACIRKDKSLYPKRPLRVFSGAHASNPD